MPNRSRDKGSRAEREIVELLRSHGLDAYRIPLSGAVSGFKNDIEIRLANQVIKLESKVRAKGFRNIYRWLQDSDGLVIKADREKTLIVLNLDLLAKVLSLIPHNPIEKPTDKPWQDPLQDTLAQPTQSEPNLIDANVVLLHDDKVYLNQPVMHPIGVASERYPDTVDEGS